VLTWGVVLAVAGCGDAGTDSREAAHAYGGALYVERDRASYPEAGAAGDVVDCRHFGNGGAFYGATYEEGATADSPDGALGNGRGEGIFEGAQHGLTVAARTDDRVLFVLEVAGVVKQAVIVHDGPAAEGTGGDGWYVESWARCDWSELPEAVVAAASQQIWTDHDGAPVSTEELVSYPGPAHCDWQSVTFLELDGDWKRTYVRQPTPELTDSLAGPYLAHTTLPGDAAPTPYERDGERLWLAADRMTAYVGSDRTDVEAWPRETTPIGCA
jgi:hypothetical protein